MFLEGGEHLFRWKGIAIDTRFVKSVSHSISNDKIENRVKHNNPILYIKPFFR